MDNRTLALEIEQRPAGAALVWLRDGLPIVAAATPAVLEMADAAAPTITGVRMTSGYAQVASSAERIDATVAIDGGEGRFRLADRWERIAEDTWRVDRRLETISVARPSGVRLLLELSPMLERRAYDDFRYFAPPALTDLNDLNEDGIEEYLETRSLHFREDRLT